MLHDVLAAKGMSIAQAQPSLTKSGFQKHPTSYVGFTARHQTILMLQALGPVLTDHSWEQSNSCLPAICC